MLKKVYAIDLEENEAPPFSLIYLIATKELIVL